MKRSLILTLTLIIASLALISFGNTKAENVSNDNKPKQNNYKTMWKQFDEHIDNSLPQSADKVLKSIEKQALKDNNQVQLLKTVLYKQKVLRETVEDDWEQEYLRFAQTKFDILDEVGKAVLHEELADAYNRYLSSNQYQINKNLRVDKDLKDVEMKYWDKKTFQDLIDQHYAEALKPVEALKAAKTEEYMALFEEPEGVSYLQYEPTMFEFLFHRISKYYKTKATADDIDPEWNTELWWLKAADFAKADLGNSESPIFLCLRIFQQLIAFNLEHDENACLFNDYRRYNFVNGILDEKELYMDKLRTLMEEHPTNKQYPGIVNELAVKMIEQQDEHPDDSTYFDNYRKALALCEQAVAAFPDNSYACKSTISRIKSVSVNLSMNQIQLPNENIPAVIYYKNIEHPYYKIIKVTEKDIEELEKLYGEEFVKALDKKDFVVENTLNLTAETDYRKHSTLVALPPLKEGIYYLFVKDSKNNKDRYNQMFQMRFQVSQLSYLTNKNVNQLEVVTLDRKTGHPQEGVTVIAQRRKWDYNIRKYVVDTVAMKKSGRDGKVVFDKSVGTDYFMITLRKGDDVLLPQGNTYVPTKQENNNSDNVTHLFTDRAIYRPGQTVYFKGIVVHHEGDDEALAVNCRETVYFKDANRQNITQASFVTDEYGSFNGSFVIPTNLLNGVFRLSAIYGSTTIRVEEYKRPTFEISFESIKEQYKLNQEVTVKGSVDALAGFGLDDIQYTYRVVRKTQFPWRCWWWWYPTVEDEQIDYGTARTDENGKFAITFNLKPSLKTKPEQQPVFTYEIEVTATSAQGETHSDTHYIRAGYNEVAISTSVGGLIEQSELKKQTMEVFNMNGQPAKSRVSRKIYRFDGQERIDYFESMNQKVDLDRQVLSDQEIKTLFPYFTFNSTSYKMQHKTLVLEDEVMVDDKTSLIPEKTTLKPGKYYIELKSLDDPLAVTAKEFSVFTEKAKQPPYATMSWQRVDKGTVHPGDKVRFHIGSSAKNVKVWVQLMHGDEVRLEKWITLNNDIQDLSYTVTEADRGDLCLKTAFIKENTYNIRNTYISVPYDNYNLNVSLATMRDKLNPGGEETWTVNITDYQDKPLEAALLAGMYDASLDEFASHYWSFNMNPSYFRSYGFSSDEHKFISSATHGEYYATWVIFDFSLPSDYPFLEVYSYRYGRALGGRVYRKGGGQEVLLEDAVMPLNAAIAEAPVMAESEEMAIEDASSTADEDASEAGGENQKAEEEAPAVRENFNETAFFFPNLRSEADGSCTFTFTMPDALTRWKLLMIAYTKDRKTGSNEYTFKSSKPVMIMADMPRYMYDTDTLWFVANVINTGDEAVTPKAKLEIFDAATMKPVDLILSDAVINMEEIVPGRSQKVRWKVAAQYDLSLLAFRFTAFAGKFSDAEQHLMPVLSSEIFMTQTLPITVKAETEKSFDFEAIANPNSHERDYSLTLNFSTNPVWYAVQSLPYLANINTDRAESAFYVFYANSLSAYIADHVPNLLAYIKKWQIETPDALLSQLEKDQDLKAIMLQETPWVLEAKSETEQRVRIANLFEINTLRQQQTETLTLLQKKQKVNGGWPWFEGMPESPYITCYILTGFGKLQKMGVWESMSKADQQKAKEICEKAVKFLEYSVAEHYREMKRYKEDWGISGTVQSELYALSFFKEQKSDKDFAKAKKYYLEHLSKKKEWTAFNFNYRAKGALLLYRTGDQKTAKLIIKSFKECAQDNEEIGMYWPKKYFSFISHIATHAEIMSAFAEIDQDQEMIDKLRVWLLTQKRTNMWENSASTADAIYALLMRGSDWFEEGKDVTLSFSGTPISTEGGEAGTGFIQRRWNANEVTEDMRHLTVNNPTPHLVWGGLFRQYFVPIDEVKSDESGFKIKREIYVETVTDDGKLLVPIGKRTLKVGDKLTVKLTFESGQDMSYVFVKDLRAAGFEPINVISRYHYGDEMCYYQSTTDTDMEFFIDFLPKGIHQVEYSMYVTKEGNLSNGYALIQCQYAPEFTAYSDGMRIVVD